MEEYTNYMKDAYKWYNDLKKKKDKSQLELSFIINIEESHKLAILENYHAKIMEDSFQNQN